MKFTRTLIAVAAGFALAATSQAIAKQALKLIEVEYEVLPHVIDVDDAMRPDAPILHDFLKLDGKPTNISGRLEHKLGDIAQTICVVIIIDVLDSFGRKDAVASA